jgi:hypothetical protein
MVLTLRNGIQAQFCFEDLTLSNITMAKSIYKKNKNTKNEEQYSETKELTRTTILELNRKLKSLLAVYQSISQGFE